MAKLDNTLTVYSKELSSLEEMDLLFENYCKECKTPLDFTKGACCNGYLNNETSEALQWFYRGIYFALTKGETN